MGDTKTHTVRVDQEQWEFLDAYARATAKRGEKPNVSAAVREAINEFRDRHPLDEDVSRKTP